MSKVLLMVLIAGLPLSGCNTVEGIGKDVKGAGESMEEAAQDNKPANRPTTHRTRW